MIEGNNTLLRSAAVIIVAALILGGAYFLYKYRTVGPEIDRTALYEEVNTLHRTGNYDAAATKLQEVIATAPTQEKRWRAEWKLANTLLHRNASGDRIEAVRLFQAIIDNPSASPYFRALSLNGLAFTYELVRSEAFMRQEVFNREPYATYLRESNTGIYGALRRIYEEADALYPNALSKIEIAFTYILAFSRGIEDPDLKQEEAAKKIQQYIREAEPLMNKQYSQSVLANMYLMRAVSLSLSETLLHNIEYSEIESAYKQALVIASERGRGVDVDMDAVFSRTSLYFALHLATRFGNTRADEIKALILPALSTSPNLLSNSARSAIALPDSAPIKMSYRNLAAVSPEFRAFLIENGREF